VRAKRSVPVVGLGAVVVLLAALDGSVGLGRPGWLIGIASGATLNACLALALTRHRVDSLGLANLVTFTRATIACGVAALVADSFAQSVSVPAIVALSSVAICLDAIDGWVARRTNTASALGARFDMEADSFLVGALSVYVSAASGAWVLTIGAARYAFVVAGWFLPWMRQQLPPRYWRKVVAATQGVVLTVAAAEVLPGAIAELALVVALAMLTESFGRDVWWLWSHRALAAEQADASPQVGRQVHRAATWTLTTFAWLLVWFALIAPNEVGRLTPGAFLRIPLEGILLVALVLVLPRKAARLLAVCVGLALGALTLVKFLDMGFFEAFGRPFHPMTDWAYLDSGVSVLSDSVGRGEAITAVVLAGVLAVGLLVFLPLSVLRLERYVNRNRSTSVRTVTAVGVVWAFCAVLGARIVPGAPIASTSAAELAYSQVTQIQEGLADREVFEDEVAVDRYRDTPGADLLTGLRGKDVIIVFVESYGRVAIEDAEISASIVPLLDDGTSRLGAAGFTSRSAFLTSPTFGGISWLAHATLQSGLWVDNQLRYDTLVGTDRVTLSVAFDRAGWRTVGHVPSNDQDWPDGTEFYGYDEVYDARNVGYRGPEFSFSTMPDQYTLAAFQRLELASGDRRPVMAEIDLTSSHTPWTPVPRMVGWNEVGDGSVYDDMPQKGESTDEVWSDPDQVRAAYQESIAYSLEAVISFVERYGDNESVFIVLGDHQPATMVSGRDASHDVPISVIAKDPAVLKRIAHWHWQAGLRPDADAPVWPMDAFRDRFLAAYGPQPAPALAPSSSEDD
jgi:phosphatidylglycerophosphate synthase